MEMLRVVVFTDGGLVLWERPGDVPDEIVRELVARRLAEGIKTGTSNSAWGARFAHNNELNVTVGILWPALARIRAPDELSSDVERIFVRICGDTILENQRQGIIEDTGLDLERFGSLVDVLLEKEASLKSSGTEVDTEQTDGPKEETKEETRAGQITHNGKNTKATPRQMAAQAARKATKSKRSGAVRDAVEETPQEKPKRNRKKGRNWDGVDYDSDEDGVLDYSASTAGDDAPTEALANLNVSDLGSKSDRGFLVKELDDILANQSSEGPSEPKESFGFLRGIVGGKKLNDGDLDAALNKMEDHLVGKNVAKEVAAAICGQVREDLRGTSTQSWTSVKATVRASITRTLRRILTPSTSTDLLVEIQKSRRDRSRPYVISVVGVNGVGKSTNLSKLAFWLLQNDLRVLVAACDTFRSGAVEQLKVHVQRLKQLTERQGTGHVDLFDQGYGKDAAVIARKAVEQGQRQHFDVVLMDTAGRRHNDDRLMSSLEKFGNLAEPNKIVMVGEALVGTDSVEQARNFDAAFGPHRGLDFLLISKCDTVGAMLGTLVNMTYATGVPVLFIGVGQQYTDLRTLSVEWAVNLMLS